MKVRGTIQYEFTTIDDASARMSFKKFLESLGNIDALQNAAVSTKLQEILESKPPRKISM